MRAIAAVLIALSVVACESYDDATPRQPTQFERYAMMRAAAGQPVFQQPVFQQYQAPQPRYTNCQRFGDQVNCTTF
jgi:hypothetical protein